MKGVGDLAQNSPLARTPGPSSTCCPASRRTLKNLDYGLGTYHGRNVTFWLLLTLPAVIFADSIVLLGTPATMSPQH